MAPLMEILEVSCIVESLVDGMAGIAFFSDLILKYKYYPISKEPQYPTLFITPTLSTVSEGCLV